MSRILLAIALATVLGPTTRSADKTTTANQTPAMKIRLKVDDKVLTATLADNKTARDFVSLLPLTLTMNDLFGREKYTYREQLLKRENGYTLTELETWPTGLLALTLRFTIATTARKSLPPALSSSER